MAEVVASILEVDPAAVRRQARAAVMAGADWLEVRLDRLPQDLDPAAVLRDLRLPVMVTCRTPRDGGGYHGTAEARRGLLQRWVDAGVAGIDLEEWEVWTPRDRGALRLVIRSHHNLTGVDDHLPALRDRLLSLGADVAKIAVTAHDLADAAPVLELMRQTEQERTPTVAFAMGADAWPTRVLACVHGAPFAYGSVPSGRPTAPGQPTVAALAGLYDVRRVGSSTAVYGVLGNPAAHSWSPELHNRVFRRLEIDAVYLPLATSRPEAVVGMLSSRRLRGLSVTAPHKTALVARCHEVDAETAATGALNTLTFLAHGIVHGSNTDVVGVRDAFLAAGLPAGRASAVVLGGGGAARAGALALARLGLDVTMMPRSLEPVREFAKAQGFQLARMDADLLDRLQPRAVVHATPVGGPGAADGERVLPDWRIPRGTYVLDMVYQTRWTPLLQAVSAAGGVPVFGLAMFLAQAREQVYRFTGRRLPVDVLGELVGGA